MAEKIYKSKKIKWELIFNILDIHKYLSLKNNLEVSLINKCLRKNYKKVIFKNLIYKKLGMQMNTYRHFLLEVKLINFKYALKDNSNFKSTNLDPFISKAIEEISDYSAYFTSLSLNNLSKIFYYFIPSIFTFNNLTRLKINECVVSVKDFIVLMEKMNKLECLELNELTFIKSEYEGFIERNIVLPSTLKKLALGLSTIAITSAPSNPYKFVNDELYVERGFFYLAQHLPNIRNLKLTANLGFMADTNNCLTLNPQLTHLSLPIENIDIETIKILSKSKVKHLELSKIYLHAIPLIQPEIYYMKSVTSLTLPTIKPINYPTLKKLLPLFSNLTKLTVKMIGYKVNYLTEILANVHKLEVIYVDTCYYLTEDVDLTIYTNVNHVKLKILDSSNILYKLPSPPVNLRSVTISTDNQYLNSFNYMKEMYMNNPYWNIYLIHKTIYCTRLDISE